MSFASWEISKAFLVIRKMRENTNENNKLLRNYNAPR
jgi:hypothetical protein